MKSKRTLNQIIFITLLFLHTSAFAIDVGRFSYIPITVNNTTENRWMEFNNLYEYDEGGRLIHAKGTGNDETWREYNKDGKQTLYKSSYGSYIITEYDSKGNKTYEKSYLDNVPTECWYGSDEILIRKKEGSSEWLYNEKGKITKHTYSNNEITYTYDDNGNLLSEISQNSDGQIWKLKEYTYDEHGSLISLRIKDDMYIQRERKKFSKKIIETVQYRYDKIRFENQYKYDKNGHKTYEKIWSENIYTHGDWWDEYYYKYDDAGNLIYKHHIWPGKDTSTNYYTYNSDNILIQEKTENREYQTPDIVQTYITDYNEQGIVIHEVFPGSDNPEHFYEYNDQNQLIHFINTYIPESEYWIEYWPNGNKKHKKSKNGDEIIYNENGDKLYSREGKIENFYFYDEHNHLYYSDGPDTHNEYHQLEYWPDGTIKKDRRYLFSDREDYSRKELTKVFEYDLWGNQTYMMEAGSYGNKEVRTEYTYEFDSKVRLKSKTWKNEYGYTQKESYTYDNNGNLLTITDDNGNSETFEYDKRGFKISHTKTYKYDDYDDYGKFIQYEKEEKEWFEYDNYGNLILLRDSNNNETRYNSRGQITSHKNKDGSSYSYEYDSDGNVISYMNTKGKTITYEYTKDENSDVIHCITSEGIEYSFAKDLEGREIYYNSKNETHYRSYDSYGNEVYHRYYSAKGNSRREWTEYEYYPNGQLKSKKIYTFSKN